MQETKSVLAGLLSSITESAKGRCVNRRNHSGPKAQNPPKGRAKPARYSGTQGKVIREIRMYPNTTAMSATKQLSRI
jgi:hypothetical protein